MAHQAKLIQEFNFALNRLKIFFNMVINSLSRIHDVNMINFTNNPVTMITFKESTLNLDDSLL